MDLNDFHKLILFFYPAPEKNNITQMTKWIKTISTLFFEISIAPLGVNYSQIDPVVIKKKDQNVFYDVIV